MTQTQSASRRLQPAVLLALFTLVASILLLTYSGDIETGDSLRLYDGLTSLAFRGDLRLDESAAQFMPALFPDTGPLPLADAAVEPGQIIASLPLLALSRLIPGLGAVHTVWLLNIIIVALTCCLLYAFSLSLGYSPAASAAAALALALTTGLWVYSTTYFREPLLGLTLLAILYVAHQLRLRAYRSVGLAAALMLLIVALMLVKASALLALPAVAIMAMPGWNRLRSRTGRRAIIALAAAAIIVIALFLILGLTDAVPAISARYGLLSRLTSINTDYLLTALGAYLISPGGSLLATSPVLLFALPGAIGMWRRGQGRLVLAAIALVIGFAAGYAVLNGVYWFGGLSWPQRFLQPVIPFVMLLTLPVFQRLLRRPISAWWLAAGPVLLYGAWIQINGVILPWGAYIQLLPGKANGLLEWSGGFYDPRYFRWFIMPQLWDTVPTRIAWLRFGLALVPLALAACAVSCAVWLTLLIRRPRSRMLAISLMLLAALAGVTLLGLGRLNQVDERVRAYDVTLPAMADVIMRETLPDQTVLLGSPSLQGYFLNHPASGAAGRIVTLPLQPGERSSPEQPAAVTGDFADALLTVDTIHLISAAAARSDRLWLLVDGGPDLWWSTRPVERYMNSRYYPLRTISTGPITRLIEYDTTDAPDATLLLGPEQPADLLFGGTIRLDGFSVPNGTTVQAGGSLPVSLQWMAEQPPQTHYTAALYLRDAGGGAVSQHDFLLGGGFQPSDTWAVGVPVWDNRALAIPAGTPPGEYQLWVKVYDFDESGTPRDLLVTGADALDATIGRLPLTITVAEAAPQAD